MPQPQMDPALAQQAIDALRRYGSQNKAAAGLGISRGTLQGRLVRAKQLGMTPTGDKPRIRVKAETVPTSLAPADYIAQRRQDDHIIALRRRLRETEDALIAEQDTRARMELLHATGLDEPVTWMPTPAIRKQTTLTPILFTSDFQTGEVIRPDEIDGINEFNQDIFVERYQAMIEKTISLADNNTGATDFPGIVYLRGGDAISGEIHEELAETNDLSSIPAVRLVYQQEREGIRRLRDHFGKVRIISIPGNHGRTTKKPHAKGYSERSFETMLSWWLASGFENDPDVTFWAPSSGEALFDVEGWQFLLSHGDRMGSRGGQGFIGPSATIARGHQKLYQNWTATGRRVDCILTAHLHTSLKLERGYANGSLAGYGEYARDLRAIPDAAKQWLLFSSREHMVSHAFELQLSRLPQRIFYDRSAA